MVVAAFIFTSPYSDAVSAAAGRTIKAPALGNIFMDIVGIPDAGVVIDGIILRVNACIAVATAGSNVDCTGVDVVVVIVVGVVVVDVIVVVVVGGSVGGTVFMMITFPIEASVSFIICVSIV